MTATSKTTESHESSTGHALASSEWLDTHFQAMHPEYEAMLRWVGIQPGWQVLDAGCGGGSFLPLLSELVGPTGKISAIDLAPENVATVEGLIRGGKLPTTFDARCASVFKLPSPDHSFDAVWCANMTQYFTDEELRLAIKELSRVVKHGGLVAIKDVDATALQVQPLPRR